MTEKLTLYNDAIRHVGGRRLADVAEDREPRHELDAVYTPALKACLEAGYWDFAMRFARLDAADVGNRDEVGFTYAFTKPSDWVRTFTASPHPTLEPPFIAREFVDEAGFYYANVDPLYIKYVSNDASYGLDLTRWPESFTDYVAVDLAIRIAPRIKGSAIDDIEKAHRRLKANALNKDAVNSPVAFPPRGTWATSRLSTLRVDGR